MRRVHYEHRPDVLYLNGAYWFHRKYYRAGTGRFYLQRVQTKSLCLRRFEDRLTQLDVGTGTGLYG